MLYIKKEKKEKELEVFLQCVLYIVDMLNIIRIYYIIDCGESVSQGVEEGPAKSPPPEMETRGRRKILLLTRCESRNTTMTVISS